MVVKELVARLEVSGVQTRQTHLGPEGPLGEHGERYSSITLSFTYHPVELLLEAFYFTSSPLPVHRHGQRIEH